MWGFLCNFFFWVRVNFGNLFAYSKPYIKIVNREWNEYKQKDNPTLVENIYNCYEDFLSNTTLPPQDFHLNYIEFCMVSGSVLSNILAILFPPSKFCHYVAHKVEAYVYLHGCTRRNVVSNLISLEFHVFSLFFLYFYFTGKENTLWNMSFV